MQRAERLVETLFSRQNAFKYLNAFVACPSKEQVIEHLESPPGIKPQLEQTLVAVKDNICTKDLPTSCASKLLAGYQSSYDATVVQLLRGAGAIIAGKTNLDEFGMGSHSTHSAFGPVKTDSGRSPGGSSGGSAVAVATAQCHAALGTDTGGSVRLPAAFTGVYGFKPSYGLVSRWGVVAYANSLDTVGFFARHPMAIKNLMDICNVPDPKDPTNITVPTRRRLLNILRQRDLRRSLRFGVPAELNLIETSECVRVAWTSTLKSLQSAGHRIYPVSLPSTRSALSAYYILAPAEASSNLAKYDGVRYGSLGPQDIESPGVLYAKTRQHGFGSEVRRRILLGAYSLSAGAIDNYFIQAQRVRRLLKSEFDSIFALPNVLSSANDTVPALENGVDAIICPTAPTLPPLSDTVAQLSSLDAYSEDVFTVPASLAGLPAISVPIASPCGPPNSASDSVGMQIITQYGDDDRAIFIADLLNDMGLCSKCEP